jgi:signal peptidase II
MFQTGAARVGFGAALGGATSNLIDWLRRGAVMDFIDLRIWPVFNLADAFIVLGLGVALWSVW